MQTVTIQGTVREGTGKGLARKLRAAGKLPANVYGKALASTPITLDVREFVDSLKTEQGANVLMNLAVAGGSLADGKTVMVREVQRDPLSGAPLHADLIEVRMDELVTVEVRLRFRGTAKGVKEGGILHELHRTIEVECLPSAIPDHFEIDVSGMEIGDTLHISDLTLPEGVSVTGEGNFGVVTIMTTRAEEPEVKEGEGAEGAAAKEGEAKDTSAKGE
jgi:large subunit ribosomal protein L25